MRQNQLAILAAAITNKDRFYDLLAYPADMFEYPFKHIYDSMVDLHNADIDFDLLTIKSNAKMNERKIQDDLFVELYQTPILINFDMAVLDLFHAYKKRKIGDHAKELYKKCQSNKLDYVDFLEEIVTLKENIDERLIKPVTHIESEFQNLLIERERERFYKTGIPELDETLIGLFNGRLIVIAANTGQGKSTLARQISQGRRFMFFSLEMMKREIAANILMQYSGVPSWKILAQRYDESEKESIQKVVGMARDRVKMLVMDDVFDIHEIINLIKYKKRRGEIDGAVLDYIQLCSGAKGENQNIRTGYITRMLKQTAQKENIPIIALSQLNRENDKNDRQPELTDLRDSGSIEQDANQIIFIYTPKDQRLLDCPECRFIVAKNRGGRVGKISGLVFDKKNSMFRGKDVDNFTDLSKMDYIHN